MDAVECGTQEVRLMAPGPGKCRECATAHEKGELHDPQSLYYQMKFRQKHGRLPTWQDAMAHCETNVQAEWTRRLKEAGVHLPESAETNMP